MFAIKEVSLENMDKVQRELAYDEARTADSTAHLSPRLQLAGCDPPSVLESAAQSAGEGAGIA